jgi:hypothetical protein
MLQYVFNRYGVLCKRVLKMVATMYKNKICMHKMRWLITNRKGSSFFLGTKEEIELFLFMCSHHVPTLFPMMSFKLPMMFLKFPMCSPRVFPIANHFIPCPLPKVLHFVTYTGSWKGEALHPHIEIAILGSLPSFFFGLMMYQSK